jgi:hypothetical protein
MQEHTMKTTSTCYTVVWPEHHIVKAGITTGRRWRDFLTRGARLHQLAIFAIPDWRDAHQLEADLHRHFATHGALAFPTRADSVWLLGRLGGHCETYRLDDLAALDTAPQPAATALRVITAADYYQPTEATP